MFSVCMSVALLMPAQAKPEEPGLLDGIRHNLLLARLDIKELERRHGVRLPPVKVNALTEMALGVLRMDASDVRDAWECAGVEIVMHNFIKDAKVRVRALQEGQKEIDRMRRRWEQEFKKDHQPKK